MLNQHVQSAVELIRRATSMVVLTGAGISTHSGIPDFRSPNSGLWEKYNPAEVASLYGFRHHPEHFYDWIQPLARTILNAQPNVAHLALAAMEQRGYLKSIITQNIDMLHSRAGSGTVYELHGHLREATCIHCFETYPADPYLLRALETRAIPRCEKCGHALKPNVILFGEQLPAQALIAARRESRQCDVMLVVGSSLEVYPAAELPVLASQSGAAVIIINLTETPVDSLAQVVIRADAVDILPEIVRTLESE